ncbi:hypothetical protein Bca4012_087126 [Brassica carinata]
MPLKLIVSTRKPHRRRIVVDKTSNRPPFTRPQRRTRSRTSQIRTKATEETKHREGEAEEKGGDPLPMVRSDTRSKTSAPESDQKKTLNKPNTLIFRRSEPNTPDLNRGGERA